MAAKDRMVDEARLDEFMAKFVQDAGAAMSAVLVVIGDRLGLYRAMADARPVTPAQLAERTGTTERYVREWLSNQAASGYVEYDPADGTFTLPPEQAMALADETARCSWPARSRSSRAMAERRARSPSASGPATGFGWHEHHPDLFAGTERFFRPGYLANLVAAWLPALDGVVEKLEAGGARRRHRLWTRRVDDRHGPGVPEHRRSRLRLPRGVDRAARRARRPTRACPTAWRSRSRARPSSAVGRSTSCASSTPCTTWATRSAAARHVRAALAPDGTWMVVEPFANDALEDNLNPVGRVLLRRVDVHLHAASLSQDGGARAGRAGRAGAAGRRRQRAGFTRVREATETPFNLVLEVRP